MAKKLSAPTARRYLPYAVLVLLYGAALLYVGSSLRKAWGFPLDDSYIHQTVARNLARYGIPGFYPGMRSSGSTSLLWTYLQAVNYRFLHSIDPVTFNFVISLFLLACIGPSLFYLARRDGLPARVCWIIAATPALCGNFIWLGLIGMEHLLFILLSLLAILFWFTPEGPSTRASSRARSVTAMLAGCSAGLIAVTRPEAIVMGPFLAVVGGKNRSFREVIYMLGAWAVFLVPLFGYNLYTSHSLMPATVEGRSWLYFHPYGGPHSLGSVIRFLGATAQRLPRQFSPRFTEYFPSLRDVSGFALLYAVVLILITSLGVYALLRRHPLRTGMLLLWATVHFLLFLFTFPSGGQGGRYQPLTLLLFFPLLALGLWFLFERISRPQAHWAFACLCLLIATGGAASLRTWRTVSMDGISHINQTHGQVAEWMNRSLPPNTVVAAFDIGRISYDWPHPLIDLGGLADPQYVPFLMHGRAADYIRAKQVKYLVLPDGIAEELGLEAKPSEPIILLKRICGSEAGWLLSFRYTGNASRCQTLYRYPGPS